MYTVGMLGSYLTQSAYAVAGPFQPFGGAVDIVVVQQEDGAFKSSPWYVKFGDLQGREKIVDISVNDVPADFHMFLDSRGDAYFEKEAECDDGAGSAPLHSGNLYADGEERAENTTLVEAKLHTTDGSLNDTNVGCATVGIASDLQSVVVEENIQVMNASSRFCGDTQNVDDASNATVVKTEAVERGLAVEDTTLDADTREIKIITEARRIIELGNVQESADFQELASAAHIDNNSSNTSIVSNSLSNVAIMTAGEELVTKMSKERDADTVGSVLTTNLLGDNKNGGVTEDTGLLTLAAQHNLEIQPTCTVDTVSNEPFGNDIPNTRKEVVQEILLSQVSSPENVELEEICSTKGSLEVKEACEVIIQGDNYSEGCTGGKIIGNIGMVLDKNKEVLNASIIDPVLKGRDLQTDAGAGGKSHEQLDRESLVWASDVWENQGTNQIASSIPNDNGSVVGEKIEHASNGGKYVVDNMEQNVSTDGGTSNKDSESQYSAVVAPLRWSLWSLSFRRPRAEKGPLFSSKTVNEALLAAATRRSFTEGALQQKNAYQKWSQKSKIRKYVPTSAQLASLKLKEGPNKVTFTFTRVLRKTEVDARIYLWKWNTRIVISDVDGTITKSDVLGQVMPLVGRDWSQLGVTRLFSAIKDNGYEVLFLSARAISQAYLTRQFLLNLKQDGEALPEGPVVISPDGLIPSLYREVIRRAPHEFKISCLEGIRELFPRDVNPFYAGFGNRITDEISYLKVGIPKGKIFIINPKGEVMVNHRVDRKSYRSLHALVDDMFPPTSSSEQEDFNSWNFWKLPLLDVKEELSANCSKTGKKGTNVKILSTLSSTQ